MDDVESMLRHQIASRGVNAPAVLAAMRTVPRELFVPDNMLDEAYADCALPIGQGQTISQPYIVALMTQSLELDPAHRVLEIGTGSGYQSAILARLAKHIYTIERLPGLTEQAKTRLTSLGIANVAYRVGDGTLGWPEQAPFDRIIITASAPDIPRRLLESQLADNGIAVLPMGTEQWQDLLQIRRQGNKLQSHILCGCRFVKLLGTEGWHA